MDGVKEVKELEITLHRDFATKQEVGRIDVEVREIARGYAVLSTELRNIADLLKSISKNLQWGVRVVVGAFIGGAVLGAAYFIALKAGIL
jgi:hypothetical protein